MELAVSSQEKGMWSSWKAVISVHLTLSDGEGLLAHIPF